MSEKDRNGKQYDETGVEAGSFEEFKKIVAALRGEHGCPWDKAQTFESLKPCMINEMTEALAGIDLYAATQNPENLCEELGDVLLQVVLLSQIAQELGLFSVEDVIRGISRKMIRRHPHVFGADLPCTQAKEVPGRWEAIKREEKKHKTEEMERREKEALKEATKFVIEQLRSCTDE